MFVFDVVVANVLLSDGTLLSVFPRTNILFCNMATTSSYNFQANINVYRIDEGLQLGRCVNDKECVKDCRVFFFF